MHDHEKLASRLSNLPTPERLRHITALVLVALDSTEHRRALLALPDSLALEAMELMWEVSYIQVGPRL